MDAIEIVIYVLLSVLFAHSWTLWYYTRRKKNLFLALLQTALFVGVIFLIFLDNLIVIQVK